MNVFGPGAHSSDYAGLDLIGADLRQFGVSGDAGHEVDAGQRRFAQKHIEVDAVGVVELSQHFLHAHAGVGVVQVAWEVEDHRDEALVGVGADENAGFAAFLHVDDLHDDVIDLFGVLVQEVLAGIVLQDSEQFVGRVGSGRESAGREDLRDLPVDDRDVEDAVVVELGFEHADEAAFADDLTVGIECLHADVVHEGRPDDAGAGVRLRQHQHMRFQGLVGDRPAQR